MLIDDCIPVAPFRGPVVCVAGGPSLTLQQVRQIGIARAQDRIRLIAVNDAVYPCWSADVLHACDRKWWELHNGVPEFPGHKTALEPVPYPGVRMLKNTGVDGFDPTPGCIRSGSNGGYQAVHIAAKIWSATKIVLVAFDYTDDGTRSHWWGRYEGAMDKHSNVQNLRKHLKVLTEELALRKIPVFNASLNSTIDWLPRLSLDHLNWDAP